MRYDHVGVRRGAAAVLALAVPLSSVACASWSNTEKGAVIGAAGGAAAGAAIGKAAGSTAKGAILGAVVGGAAGAYIGSRMDDAADELEDELDNAKVERVGEGLQITFASGILFPFDSSELKDAARENLGDLARVLNDYEEFDVLVVGHTDSTGDEGYNLGLSSRRSEAALTYLQTRGVASSRIYTQGRGEYEPVATNETEAGRQLNRRVEVAVYASEEYRQQVKERFGN